MRRTVILTHVAFIVDLDQDEDGRWVATVPALQGCYADGATEADALRMIEDAIRLHLEDRGAMTHPELKSRQEDEERELVHEALVSTDWHLANAAKRIDRPVTSLRKMITRLGLEEEYLAHNPGRGRRKSAQ